MSKAQDVIDAAIKGGLKRVISDEAMRRADAQGIGYDIIWEDTPESYFRYVEDLGDTAEEGEDEGELWDDEDDSPTPNVALEELFPKSEYGLSEDNKPLEVDETHLLDQNASYEDKLE